jgi:hypothetical protein
MSFKTFVLLLIILACGAFIYVKVESLGSDQNSFNQHERYVLGKYPFLRTLLSLHKDGDARAEFLQGSSSIVIDVSIAPGTVLDPDVINNFAAQVSKYTGSKTKVYYVDGVVPDGMLGQNDLDKVMQRTKRNFEPGSSILAVAYTDDFTSSDQAVGKTYQEYGIVISNQRLRDVTNLSPQSLPELQQSTLVHEFGHQLGLDHNTEGGCVMNAAVESPEVISVFVPPTIPTDFCTFELDQLQQIKASLK